MHQEVFDGFYPLMNFISNVSLVSIIVRYFMAFVCSLFVWFLTITTTSIVEEGM